MTTTHSEPDRPETKPRRGLGDLSLLAGLALAPLAFAAGGYAAALALPGVFIARLRPAAFVLFAGVAVCFGLSLAGANPWAAFARERVLDELEDALGARPEYTAWSYDTTAGRMRFDNLTVKVPEMSGSAELIQLEIDAGFGFLWRGSPALYGRGLTLKFDGASARPQDFMARLDNGPGRELSLEFETVQVEVSGEAVSAKVAIERVLGSADEDGFRVGIAPSRVDLSVWGQTHALNTAGNVVMTRREGNTRLAFDLVARDEEVLMAYLAGTLGAEPGPETLVLSVDWLNLQPLWARYRKIDVYGGTARGKVRMWGGLDDLHLGLDFEISEYSYFHRMVMALDESRAFRVPRGKLTGELRLLDGAKVMVNALKLEVPEATLCTDPQFSARGGGNVTLSGQWPKLAGKMEATVESGALSAPISWSPVSTASIRDVQPNIVMVAEQFPDLTLDWTVDVKDLRVTCDPLQGRLAGKLTGTLRKTPESRNAGLRAGGTLALAGGSFSFCGASGSVTGAIEFNPNAPSFEATIRGGLAGTVGETTLTAEITGSVSHPGLVFTGMTMSGEDLGKLIATWSAQPMDTAARTRRTEDITRLCGPMAAMNGNPFLAMRGGKVSFAFKP